MSENHLPKRDEVDPKYTWNATSVFADEAAYQRALKEAGAGCSDVNSLEETMARSSADLVEALASIFELKNLADKILMFAVMSSAVDRTDPVATAKQGEAMALYGQVAAATSFLDPALLVIGREKLDQWVSQNEGLAIYSHYFDNLFRKQAHVRSAEVEEVMGLLAEPFSGPATTHNKLVDSDFSFEPAMSESGHAVNFSNATFFEIMLSSDRNARRTAWKSQTDTYLQFKNTSAALLETSIKQNVLEMRARRYRSTLEMALFTQNIPVDVYHNLIDTFRRNIPTWQRYWAIRRKAMNVEKLYPYDIGAPLSKDPPRIPYEKAVKWICQGLAPMGEEYVETIRRGCLEERWVDVYPNVGKMEGAFSYGSQGTHPFIMMSYDESALGLGTLAHELGHSMHSYLTWKHQPAVYNGYSLFAAEVASNFHQAMLRDHLFATNPDRDLQLALISEAMANFYRYFLVMPTLARFELEVHQRIEAGKGLTADMLIELMADLFTEAYGDGIEIDRERVGITWATFGHLYQDYYVFQYATGISGAHALSRRIISGEDGAVQDYLGFLKAGGSRYPLDTLKAAGVDLSSPEPVEETFAVFSELVERLEALVTE